MGRRPGVPSGSRPHTVWEPGGTLRKPITLIAALLLLALAVVPAAFASGATTSDMEDGGGIAQLSHEDVRGVVKYTVTAFDTIRQSDVRVMRWDLDLDGDGMVGSTADACIVLRPVDGRRVLRTDLYDGCTGDAVATSETRTKGNTLKVRLLLEELQDAGLDDEADGYAYRFRAVTADGTTDDVPDAPAAFITHTLGESAQDSSGSSSTASGSGSSSDVIVGQSSGSVQAGERARGDAAAAARKREDRGGNDTRSAGTADEPVVEPGGDVEIHASGFGRNQPLTISLVGGDAATPTATQSPSPSPAATPTPTATPAATNQAQAADTYRPASSRTPVAPPAVAAQAAGQPIGIAVSDEDGRLDDNVEIPEETKPGDYTIVVTGRNDGGGVHTATIPIKVAAEVGDGSSGDDATSGQVSNATGTATQASPLPVVATPLGTTLPTTGSSHLTLLAGLGALALLLGGSMIFARRVLSTSGAPAAGALPPSHPGVRRPLFELPGLRGEMQRLLALRPHRHDPDRHPDL